LKVENQTRNNKIDRRQFLKYTGASTVGPALLGHISCGRQATKIKDRASRLMDEVLKYRKVDSHAHVGRRLLANLIDTADRLGIEKLAVSRPLTDDAPPHLFREANDIVLDAMSQYPDRILGQCFINPIYLREALEEVDRCMDQGMVQLGELYTQVKINDPLYYPVIEKCIELKIPIMMHSSGDLGLLRNGYRTPSPPTTSFADDFVDIGKRYPEAMIIHAHIGGGGDWEYACKTLRNVPSIYVDTSGSVTDEGMIDFAVKYLGIERLLFATDMNFESGVGKILAANLTEEQRQKIFWENFNNILRKRGNHAH